MTGSFKVVYAVEVKVSTGYRMVSFPAVGIEPVPRILTEQYLNVSQRVLRVLLFRLYPAVADCPVER
jgi:hypothetical protein